MSRTLRNLCPGTGIWLKENGSDVEYILMYKDSQGGVLLRKDVDQTKRMNATNSTTYEGSEMDVWLSDADSGFLSRFDSATMNAIIARSIPTFSYGDTNCTYIDRRCYLLSQANMFLAAPTATEPELNYSSALMKYYNANDLNTSRIGKLNNTAVSWWLRSTYSATHYYCVNYNGTQGGNNAAGSSGVRPALNVSLDTIVSDEGADKIYLMPVLGYREVEFSGLVYSSTAKVKNAMVNYNAVGLYDIDVQITNNYGDTNPVWVDATSQQIVELTNEHKETTEWKIGVRCYGKSSGYGYFEEPIVKMEVE